MIFPFRIGFGYDVHAFSPERELWLGGILIPHTCGLLGHSDADVLIHALCDALLGAASLRDIGFHFPDNDPTLKNVDSKKLLKKTMFLLREKGYELGNADITVCAEQPKLNPHISSMIETLSDAMDVSSEVLSVKATTTERLGFVGRMEGMAAYASVIVYRVGE